AIKSTQFRRLTNLAQSCCSRRGPRLEVELLEDRCLLSTGLDAIPGLTETNPGKTVAGMYYQLLYRIPTATEGAAWITGPGAQSPLQIANALISSDEYRSNLIADYYGEFLNRIPRSQEVQSWLSLMRAGWGEEQIAATFIGSTECYQNNNSDP